jgi:hypothetical protein
VKKEKCLPSFVLDKSFFFLVLGRELRAFTLSHSTRPFFEGFFSRLGLANYLSRLASNCDPPDLCLLSSWDYRCELSVPGLYCIILTEPYPENKAMLFPRHIKYFVKIFLFCLWVYKKIDQVLIFKKREVTLPIE